MGQRVQSAQPQASGAQLAPLYPSFVDFMVKYIMVFVKRGGISALNIGRLIIYRGIVFLKFLID